MSDFKSLQFIRMFHGTFLNELIEILRFFNVLRVISI
jgi:hypothetical protein